MTDRRDHLKLRLGAIFLALATVAAVSFAIINLQQRMLFDVPDDGVSWVDSPSGIQAFAVAENSPAARAGIKAGDILLAVDGLAVHRALDVTKRLWSVGVWGQLRYELERTGESFQASLIVEPAPKPVTIENYLRAVGLLYLFIGLFIFARRWNAPRAVHFYVFCLVSFILYEFRYTGKLNLFDWEIYWAQAVATLLAPALLVHFALVFPERSIARRLGHRLTILGTYVAPAILLLVHVQAATGSLGFVPIAGGADRAGSARTELSGAVFPAGGRDFPEQLPPRAERRAAAAVEVGDRRNAGGDRAVRTFLRAAVFAGRGSAGRG